MKTPLPSDHGTATGEHNLWMSKLPLQTKEYFSLCGGRHLALLISLLWRVSLPGFSDRDNYKRICSQGLQVGRRKGREKSRIPTVLSCQWSTIMFKMSTASLSLTSLQAKSLLSCEKMFVNVIPTIQNVEMSEKF